jgi:AcrR family transcriptional regulator
LTVAEAQEVSVMGLKERRAREKAARRENILKAARSLLSRRGLEGTSMTRIARDAELGVSTIYSYYRDKEELFAALQCEGLEILGREMAERCRELREPEAKLSAMASVYLRFSESHSNYFEIINFFLSTPRVMLSPELKARVDRRGAEILSLVAGAISEGVDEGRFGPRHAAREAAVLWATLHGLIQQRKIQATVLRGEDPVVLYEYAVERFIQALRKRQPIPQPGRGPAKGRRA